MFGQLGQLAGLLKNAGKIRESMERMQQRLAAARFVGDAGAGQVQATVDGRGEMVSMKISPVLLSGGDVELLEDLVCAAVRDAVNRSREGMAKEMQDVTGGLGLPAGMEGLLGGGPQP
ncbi:Nucleoid-associated protein YbaB [Phycisphaerae bacterium RAS1]|nr:Nucleoid-associated protein YbaB [Phycisphaerae bacterium RAS1]